MKKFLVLLCALMLSVSALAVQPYSVVYEPETSVMLPATIAWKADETAADVAAGEIRPGTGLVYLNRELKVTSEDGAPIADGLDEYIKATAGTIIPALYVSDAETAAALKTYLENTQLGDVFVAASYENAALVDDVAQLLHVRGMVDFRSAPVDIDMTEIIRTTNANHAKVALLPDGLATGENIDLLQRQLITVWVETDCSLKSLLTRFTGGVNGVLVDDYRAAIDALAFFDDDVPTLLRMPRILAHRGMPSMYIENTLLSALGAYSAGADAIETDIYLSADDELFVLHDGNMTRLFNRGDIADVEALTLAELQSIPFDPDGESGVQAKNNTPATKSARGEILMLPSQRIPSLEEMYTTLQGSGAAQVTEIKSQNPAIVAALRELVEETGNFDEVFVITFNTVILDEMAASWPEISVGALGTQGSKKVEGQPEYGDYDKIIQKKSVEKALELLYAQLDQWNATFNPNRSFSYELAVAGRHRGLTVWPWTYNEPELFADAYLKGLNGITTNYTWWTTDYVGEITARDVWTSVGGTLPAPVVKTRGGERIRPENLELIVLEGSLGVPGEALAIYRLRQELTVDGKGFGEYCLYSNPFTITSK